MDPATYSATNVNNYGGAKTVQATAIEEKCLLRSECDCVHHQEHGGNKRFLQSSPPVLNWRCWLMQIVLYNGCKTVE